MVLLTLTVASKAAVDEFCARKTPVKEEKEQIERLSKLELGSAIEHYDLVDVSRYCVQQSRTSENGDDDARSWRLEALLKDAVVYRPPPDPKPEPVSPLNGFCCGLPAQTEFMLDIRI